MGRPEVEPPERTSVVFVEGDNPVGKWLGGQYYIDSSGGPYVKTQALNIFMF
jgi:hypothetical protein